MSEETNRAEELTPIEWYNKQLDIIGKDWIDSKIHSNKHAILCEEAYLEAKRREKQYADERVKEALEEVENSHYKWSKLFTAKRHNSKDGIVKLTPLEQQELLDDMKPKHDK